MLRLSANLSFLFTELPFRKRFAAAADAGFEGVEFLFPYDMDANELADLARGNGLEIVLFNVSPGDWDGGYRGLAGVAGAEADFRARFGQALEYARSLGCRRLHVMAGLTQHGANEETLIANLMWAAPLAAEQSVTLLVEPINGKDMPGYLVRTTEQAIGLLSTVAAANVLLQLDLYHRHIEEGDVAEALAMPVARIGHIQIAGPPDRGEPIPSELDVPGLFKRIDEMGYRGWVGCEYRPRGTTLEGLNWRSAAGLG